MTRVTIHLPTLPTVRDVTRVLDAAANLAREELQRDTAAWQHQPIWTIRGGAYQREITTDDDIYIYQDEGTRPHEIVPRRARMLRFEAGGGIVYARRVAHPGTKPQRLVAQARARIQRRLKEIL